MSDRAATGSSAAAIRPGRSTAARATSATTTRLFTRPVYTSARAGPGPRRSIGGFAILWYGDALMAATPLPAVTILADDLTGACDTGCLFAGAGPVAVTVPGVLEAHDRAVLAVDTETRMLPDAAAAAVLREAARRLRPRLAAGPVFKKIDSTMRGPVAAEVAALLEHGPPFAGALVCPAFPAERRVV